MLEGWPPTVEGFQQRTLVISSFGACHLIVQSVNVWLTISTCVLVDHGWFCNNKNRLILLYVHACLALDPHPDSSFMQVSKPCPRVSYHFMRGVVCQHSLLTGHPPPSAIEWSQPPSGDHGAHWRPTNLNQGPQAVRKRHTPSGSQS